MAGTVHRDPFALLGVPRTADADDLRAARRRLAMDEHPDRGGSAARMQAINVAFEEAMALLQRAAQPRADEATKTTSTAGHASTSEPSPSGSPMGRAGRAVLRDRGASGQRPSRRSWSWPPGWARSWSTTLPTCSRRTSTSQPSAGAVWSSCLKPAAAP